MTRRNRLISLFVLKKVRGKGAVMIKSSCLHLVKRLGIGLIMDILK